MENCSKRKNRTSSRTGLHLDDDTAMGATRWLTFELHNLASTLSKLGALPFQPGSLVTCKHTPILPHLYDVLILVHLIIPGCRTNLPAILVNKIKAHDFALSARVCPPEHTAKKPDKLDA